jgi:hypothetical protein
LIDIEKEIEMNNEIIVQNQLTLMNDCFHCLQLNELCCDCIEAKEARDAIIANQMVDESSDYIVMGYGSNEYRVANGGTITESSPMSGMHDQPSGHDWTERASELREQTTWLVDRLFILEDSIELTTHECICSVCHYTINKHAVCPNCN